MKRVRHYLYLQLLLLFPAFQHGGPPPGKLLLWIYGYDQLCILPLPRVRGFFFEFVFCEAHLQRDQVGLAGTGGVG